MCRSKRNEKGQTVVEYGLIIAVIALVTIVAFPPLRVSIVNLFERFKTTLDESSVISPQESGYHWDSSSSSYVFKSPFLNPLGKEIV